LPRIIEVQEGIRMTEEKKSRRKIPFMGAIVFLIVFVILLMVTLAYPNLPPAKQLYGLLNIPETTQPVLGVPATLLIEAVFNGVIYGFIAWVIFTIGKWLSKKQ
jgi:ABC-type Fe3+ transport system permease subunit